MRKLIIVLFISLLLVGCGSNVGSIEGLSESQLAFLQEAGISEEEFAAMPSEKQQALLDELGYVDKQQQQSNSQSSSKKATLDDVKNGGNYVVTVGDSMLWNYVELHYEDGKLVKIYMSFQKNDDEPVEEYTFVGDEAINCTFFNIDYSQDPKDVVDDLLDYGYTNVYIEKV